MGGGWRCLGPVGMTQSVVSVSLNGTGEAGSRVDVGIKDSWTIHTRTFDSAGREDCPAVHTGLGVLRHRDKKSERHRQSGPALCHRSSRKVWICQISQENSQKRTRERMSDQEAKEIKAEAREIMPQPSTHIDLSQYANWAMVSSYFVQLLLQNGIPLWYINGERYAITWTRIDQVFIPVNEPGEHWCLTQFGVLFGVVTFYDSGDSFDVVYANRMILHV
ncbi:phospholipase-like protein [Tanacetum coccineum]